MGIIKYEVINPVIDSNKAFYDTKKQLLFIPVKTNYRYYVECALNNEFGGRDYYILLSRNKFDDNCRLCKTDQYGRCQIKLRGEIQSYVEEETKYRGNIEVEYVESEDNYDIFNIL